MIRTADFEIRFEPESSGAIVRVKHKPTGNQRVGLATPAEGVGRVRDQLIAELRGKLCGPEDIRVDIGRTEGGDFIRVVHIPSGIQRSAMRRDRTEFELLDEVLEELYLDPDILKQVQDG